ncbi:UvrD-helicase domain-containing protein [Deinococcus sp. QL22]|uniref:UvrD-helicase domain-containing protein n=1 Tax=Deinococcus sp. QL22 TaxID=2939437 RepID=UPI0020171325|nr:UvrD-helicase domain-containing protein [Deinococcus sp. QL22]UQN09669.1 AAA family ATPase [Deinococcus sp. QL22]
MTYVTRQGETLRTTSAKPRPIPAQFTLQQREFVEAVRASGRHLVLRATAGSGKTTTLTEAAWHLGSESGGSDVKGVYFAYNKHSVEAVGPRLPPGIRASTLHAYGRRVLCGVRGPQMALDNDRSLRLAELVYSSEPVSRRQLRGAARMWDLAREYVLNEDSHDDDLVALAADAEWPENDGVAGLRRVLRAFRYHSIQDWHAGGLPDFTDFLWLPLELGLGRGTLGAALVDEAQDLTPLRQRFVTHLLGLESGEAQEALPTGRFIAVGDPEQAIYTYAGADPRGLWRLAERLSAQELPLSVSFRCPVTHVALARTASEFIQPSGAAQAGTVEHVAADAAHYGRGDVVLCRLNAPLLRLALLLMTRHISVNIRGRDLATRLETAAQEAFAVPADEEAVPDRVAALYERRARPLQYRAGEGDRAAKKALGELNDLCSCLRLLALRAAASAGGKATLSSVSGVLRGLYREDADVLLSTVHRAKGLEWERVTLLYPEQMPMPYGDPEEERCVLFVALTRSKRELRLAYGPGAWESGWRLEAPEGWQPESGPSTSPQPQPAPPPIFSFPPLAPPLPSALVLPPKPYRLPVTRPLPAVPPSSAALTEHALRVRAVHRPATLEDLRPYPLYSGQANLPVAVLAARLEVLRQDARPALSEWAGASLALLRDVQSRSVYLDVMRLAQVERAATRARLAIPLMQPLTAEQVCTVVFGEHFARLRPAQVKRRGERNWRVELDGEAHAFDPRTGELLGTPFAPFAVHLRLER